MATQGVSWEHAPAWGQGRYVPPHIRHKKEEESSCRSVEAIRDNYWQITLVVSPDTCFNINTCPDEVEAITSMVEEAEGMKVYRVKSPSGASQDQIEELLAWFQEECTSTSARHPSGDERAVLKLPKCLSKAERAEWHHACEQFAQLNTVSHGVGCDRHLVISRKVTTSGSEGRGGQRETRPTKSRVSHEARKIWSWCQEEGGAFWNYSQNEVQTSMMAEGGPPPELAELIQKRETAEKLHTAIAAGDEAAALTLLDAHPQCAWVRETKTRSFPIHGAVLNHLSSLVAALGRLPGVVEQRDGDRLTPLQLAKEQHHEDLVDILKEMGAKDLSSPTGHGQQRVDLRQAPDRVRTSGQGAGSPADGDHWRRGGGVQRVLNGQYKRGSRQEGNRVQQAPSSDRPRWDKRVGSGEVERSGAREEEDSAAAKGEGISWQCLEEPRVGGVEGGSSGCPDKSDARLAAACETEKVDKGQPQVGHTEPISSPRGGWRRVSVGNVVDVEGGGGQEGPAYRSISCGGASKLKSCMRRSASHKNVHWGGEEVQLLPPKEDPVGEGDVAVGYGTYKGGHGSRCRVDLVHVPDVPVAPCQTSQPSETPSSHNEGPHLVSLEQAVVDVVPKSGPSVALQPDAADIGATGNKEDNTLGKASSGRKGQAWWW